MLLISTTQLKKYLRSFLKNGVLKHQNHIKGHC